MSNKVILKAEDLDGYLTSDDMTELKTLDEMFKDTMQYFDPVNEEKIIEGYDKMGHEMQKICKKHPQIKVYTFESEQQAQAEASRVISKLRDVRTDHQEFMYYSQRAYEMLFRMAYINQKTDKRGHIVVKTPVNFPVQNYAVHKFLTSTTKSTTQSCA